ncbi:mediator of RNA polymerase II transcription subunit 11-like [Diadema setosum]|uniref:mediator of RNA polymerase II transcription subunit 11-like n=1 Tax=Diadema antillarum TaxID=105358 RepID=UPI003A8BE0FE
MSSSFEDRLKQLENIETDIACVVQNAGKVVLELSKDRPVEKQIETNTKTFVKTLESVEKRLTEQINYLSQVSTGQPHEGSSYPAQKEAQMAIHRLENAKTKLMEIKGTLSM